MTPEKKKIAADLISTLVDGMIDIADAKANQSDRPYWDDQTYQIGSDLKKKLMEILENVDD